MQYGFRRKRDFMPFKKGYDPNRHKLTTEERSKGGKKGGSTKGKLNNLKHGRYSKLLELSRECSTCILNNICPYYEFKAKCKVEVEAVKVLMNSFNSADPNMLIDEINKTMIPLYVQVKATNDPELTMKFQNQMIKIFKLIHPTPEITFSKTQILQVGEQSGSVGRRGDERTTKTLISSVREFMEGTE